MVDRVEEVDNGRGYVDWPAVFAGSVVAAGVILVLTAFAAALGLNAIEFDDEGGVSTIWLIVTGLFAVISMVAAYMLGGYVAGRMRRPVGGVKRDETTIRDGMNGLVVWGVGMLLSAILAGGLISAGLRTAGSAAQTAIETAGSAVGGIAQGTGQIAGGIISGTGQAIGGAAQGAAQAAGPALSDMLPQGIQANPLDYITDRLLRPGGPTPAQTLEQDVEQNLNATQSQIVGIFANVIRTGEISDQDREWLQTQVAARTGLSESEVETRVDEAVQSVQDIRAEAQQRLDEAQAQLEEMQAEAQQAIDDAQARAAEVAEQTRIAGILSAFLLAAASLVAAAASYIGAVRGGRHRDEGRVWGGLSYDR